MILSNGDDKRRVNGTVKRGNEVIGEDKQLKYFSMFSGIGGFELGIQKAAPYAECIGYSEVDKYAISVYERNFNGHKNYGDATQINPGELPRFDLLVGGFPCQAFSVAGKRQGFDDTRGTLFFDIARILKAKRPRHLVLENVKGLLSHDSGKTFATILGVLSDLGYFVEWQVLNSKDFGVPQNRERIYIVGHFGGAPRRQVFPLRSDSGTVDELPGHHTNTVTARYGGSQAVGTYVIESQLDAQSPTVRVREATKTGYAEATVGDSINISVPNSKTRRGRVQRGLAWTLQTSENQATLTPDARIRRLTPKECERLQGFPDDWTRYNSDDKEVSDSQRYKMCGNAVTVNVVRAVMERIDFNE